MPRKISGVSHFGAGFSFTDLFDDHGISHSKLQSQANGLLETFLYVEKMKFSIRHWHFTNKKEGISYEIAMTASTYNCFSEGNPSKAPWKMWTIRLSDIFNLSSVWISPNVLLFIARSEFSPKSSRRRLVKLAKSAASIADIWLRLKSLKEQHTSHKQICCNFCAIIRWHWWLTIELHRIW